LCAADIGSFIPNGYGIFDMVGNVLEWTQSQYLDYPYGADGRESLSASEPRVLQGGSWHLEGPMCFAT
jgi:formylglycine-generating enzyme required for sulfatase activity